MFSVFSTFTSRLEVKRRREKARGRKEKRKEKEMRKAARTIRSLSFLGGTGEDEGKGVSRNGKGGKEISAVVEPDVI